MFGVVFDVFRLLFVCLFVWLWSFLWGLCRFVGWVPLVNIQTTSKIGWPSHPPKLQHAAGWKPTNQTGTFSGDEEKTRRICCFFGFHCVLGFWSPLESKDSFMFVTRKENYTGIPQIAFPKKTKTPWVFFYLKSPTGRQMKGDKWRRETRSGSDFGNQQPNLWEVRTPIAIWGKNVLSCKDFQKHNNT